jgi:very-short-patch-repair endonuclease
MLPYNKNLKHLARELRKNMTDAERHLGNYIVDFYCPAAKLIVEVDGGQHFVKENIQEDRARDHFLCDLGFNVLRFSNRDIFKNIEGVVQKIYDHLGNPPGPL